MEKYYGDTYVNLNEYIIIITDEGLPALHPIKKIEIMKEAFEIEEIIDLFAKIYHMNEMDSERLYVVSFNYNMIPKGICLASMGNNMKTMTPTRTIGEFLLLTGAEKFLLLHNHPDSSEEPSEGDIDNMSVFQQIANLFEIEFIGSFIINRNSWFDIKNMESHSLEEVEYNEKIGW